MPKSADSPSKRDLSAEAMQLIEQIEHELADGNIYPVSPDTVQSLMGLACRLYGAHRNNGERYLPVGGHNAITSTDAVLGLQRAVGRRGPVGVRVRHVEELQRRMTARPHLLQA